MSEKRKAPIEREQCTKAVKLNANEYIEYGPVCAQAAKALFDGQRFHAQHFGITPMSSSQSRIVDHRDQATAFARLFSIQPPTVCHSTSHVSTEQHTADDAPVRVPNSLCECVIGLHFDHVCSLDMFWELHILCMVLHLLWIALGREDRYSE